MQRYFFDINDGKSRVQDDRGQAVPDLQAARNLAFQELALIIRDEMPDGHRASYVVTVRDEIGKPVFVAAAVLIGETLV